MGLPLSNPKGGGGRRRAREKEKGEKEREKRKERKRAEDANSRATRSQNENDFAILRTKYINVTAEDRIPAVASVHQSILCSTYLYLFSPEQLHVSTDSRRR